MQIMLPQQQRRARSILMRLPTEVLFHFWDILLHNSSYEDFTKALMCFPSWSIEIVTDNVQRCSELYGANSSSIRSFSDFEKGSKSDIGKLVRRVLVSFDCDKAVQTGEMSAYERCRYACHFFSPLIDACYCLIAPHYGVHTSYTEELLLRFQMIGGRLPVRLHVVKHPDALDSAEEEAAQSCTGDSYKRTTTLRSKVTGEILDLRVSFTSKCMMRERANEYWLGCLNPSVKLTYDMLAAQVHISFRGSRIPTVAYTEPGYREVSMATLVDETVASKFKHLARRASKQRFAVSNLNWSLLTPHGTATPLCEHWDATSWVIGDREDQVGFNANQLGTSESMYFAALYKSIWMFGIPDGTAWNLVNHTTNLEEIVWFRLTSPNVGPHPLSPLAIFLERIKGPRIYSNFLERIAFFTELKRDKFCDSRGLPSFSGKNHMDCIQLVALENSDIAWNVNQVIKSHKLLGVRSIRSLEVLQLKNTLRRADPGEQLELDWENLGEVAMFVQEFTVGGYRPAFALEPQKHAPADKHKCFSKEFTRLELLCLDVSGLVSWDQSREYILWYELCFPEKLFPRLRHLYLKGVEHPANSCPKLDLPKTCTTLDLSAVIRGKVMVNSQLLVIPNIPVVADTFNRWVLSKETDDYVYEGRGQDMFIRRIEKIDESLRPI